MNCSLVDEAAGRARRSVEFLLLVNADVLIFSGGRTSPECDLSEARAMYDIVKEKIPEHVQVFLEELSTTTEENAIFTKRLLDQVQSPDVVYVVTSCYHIARSAYIFRHIMQGYKIEAGMCYAGNPQRVESEVLKLKEFQDRYQLR